MFAKQHLARLAGLFYLVVIVAGGWSELAVRADLTVADDLPATAANIADASGPMRAAFAADVVMIAAFLFVGLTLWMLLKEVSSEAATAMLVFNAISVAVMSANMLNHAAVVVLADASYTVELGADSASALMAFFLDLHGIGYFVAQVFFGLYLLPLGYLVYRSGWLPRVIGAMLMVGWLADMGQVAVEYFAADASPGLVEAIAAPAGIAELTLALWLLARGLRLPARTASVPAAA